MGFVLTINISSADLHHTADLAFLHISGEKAKAFLDCELALYVDI